MMAEKTCVKVLVEENGEHGFDSYRVPGIVTASNGDLLLTYEGREAGGNRSPPGLPESRFRSLCNLPAEVHSRRQDILSEIPG